MNPMSPLYLIRQVLDLAHKHDGDCIFALSFNTANWGDTLNKWLLAQVTKKRICIVDIMIYNRLLRVYDAYKDIDVLLPIGSILGYARKNSIVWGAGAVWYKDWPANKPRKILAVRGPMSHEVLRRGGMDAPRLYGDPALLLRKYLDLRSLPAEKRLVGIIPHVNDKSLVMQAFSGNDEISIIDIESQTLDFVNAVAQCKFIVSSSLHGLIAGDVLNKPTLWWQMSDKVDGHEFKFLDYYSSLYGSQDRIPNDICYKGRGSIASLIAKCTVKPQLRNVEDLEAALLDYLEQGE